MGRTVWTLPPFGRYDEEKMTAWCAAQGFDANDISAEGFHITQEPRGVYVARGRKFERDDDGELVYDHTDVVRNYEWSRPVSDLPPDVRLTPADPTQQQTQEQTP